MTNRHLKTTGLNIIGLVGEFLNGIYGTLLKSVMGKYIFYVFQLVTLVVLARILSPADYGAFALINSLFLMFIFIADMGLTPILIAEKNMDSDKEFQILLLNIVSGILLSLIFVLICYILMSGDRISFLWHSAAIFFFSISTLFCANLVKSERFITFGMIESLSEVISLVFIFFLYYLNFVSPVDMLFIKLLSFYTIRFIAMFCASEIKLNFSARLNINYVLEMVSISFNQSKFNMSVCFSRNADNFFVGKFFGFHDLGLYDRAYNILKYPMLLVTFAIGPAIQPSLLKIADNAELFETTVSNLINRIFIVSVLIMGFFCVYVEQIVYLILGDDWRGVSETLYIFGFSIPFQVLFGVFSGIYQAKNEYSNLFKIGLTSSAFICISMFFALLFNSLNTFSLLVSLSYILSAVYGLFILYARIMNASYKFIVNRFGFSLVLYCVVSVLVINF